MGTIIGLKIKYPILKPKKNDTMQQDEVNIYPIVNILFRFNI
ncbi:hypothetical protein P872_18025 [Rhodonellum psychrophilum GCM71 = DSM 17998]|uniref:Uncharacterized protein n=1 Tax=Rhodonellum psychrophilum GCM71 = DSM 17998 TaxID=1123057 RepID=U5C2M3_9BACT|nr:hypothetical protein P872_18025 [Rhodonellum psychrophilum GCM71 = DSM 17998]